MFGFISKKNIKETINKRILEIERLEKLHGKAKSFYAAKNMQKLKKDLNL